MYCVCLHAEALTEPGSKPNPGGQSLCKDTDVGTLICSTSEDSEWHLCWQAKRMAVYLGTEENHDCDAARCVICHCDDERPLWIMCDNCDRWFHLFCTGKKYALDNFICEFCV